MILNIRNIFNRIKAANENATHVRREVNIAEDAELIGEGNKKLR